MAVMEHDFRHLASVQTDRISELCHGLTAQQWAHPSLCAGWTVKDVVAHMTFGFVTPLAKVAFIVARYRGNIDRASDELSRRVAAETPADELVARYDRGRARPRGLGKLIKADELFADNAIHELDITVPLGTVRSRSADEHVALLETLCHADGKFFAPARNARDLAFRATDVRWAHAHHRDPLIEGPAQSIELALAGRQEGLDGLSGEGVAELRRRISRVPVAV